MPKEVQPLENAAKIYYAATFPTGLSLLLLERKSTTLQHMFTDFLEVEENLEMSKSLSSQGSGAEVKDTLKLVGPYKQNGRVLVPLKPSSGIQKDDCPDTGTCDPVGHSLKIATCTTTGPYKTILRRNLVHLCTMNMRKNTYGMYLRS